MKQINTPCGRSKSVNKDICKTKTKSMTGPNSTKAGQSQTEEPGLILDTYKI